MTKRPRPGRTSPEMTSIQSAEMQHEQDPRRKPTKSAVALLLTFAAGFVDVVGYIAVYHLFTAHMTGTTVHLGQKLVAGDYTAAAVAATIIASFISASVIGRMIIEIGARRRFRRIASVSLSTEAALLAAFVPIATQVLNVRHHAESLTQICELVAILAAAMGIQTATLTRVGPLTVHTTFVTGMLNKFAQLSSHVLFYTYDIARNHDRRLKLERATALGQWGFIFSIWWIYLGGSVAGAWLGLKWGVRSIYLPAGLLLIAIAVDQVRPLSVEEEHDEPEQ